MTRLQKLQIEQSELRSKIGAALDTAGDKRSETWQSDLDTLTKRAQTLESELRAALVVGEGEEETREEEETTETPEGRELAGLLKRSSIEDYLADSLFDERLDGASLELRQALELPPNQVPLDLFLETRADVATNVDAADAPQENQQSIAARVFAATAGAYMGIERPTVPVGTTSYVTLASGTTADVRSDGAAKDAEAATFTTKSVDPVRVTARYLFGVESAARLRGMEEALRADLAALMGDKLDRLALRGQAAAGNTSPAVEGLLSQLAQPTDPLSESSWTDYAYSYVNRVDGKYSQDGTNVRMLVAPDAFKHAHRLEVALSSSNSLSDPLPGARFRASANMPNAASLIAKGVTYAAGSRRGFVQPVWRGVSIIRDPYTKAETGQIALTVIMLGGGGPGRLRPVHDAQIQDSDIAAMFVYPVELEYRQRGRQLSGSFAYGSVATLRDRGRVRKESFGPRAFRFAVRDADREIDLLAGHSFDRPLASKRGGSLLLDDSDEALEFSAELPPEREQPSWMVDTVKAVRGGLVRGVSPGFRVPPASAVPNAEELVPEPGNPGVLIRRINQAVLFELSLVTRPAYGDTEVELRTGEGVSKMDRGTERLYRWL